LGQLEQDLEAKAPAHQRRLEALEVQLDEVSARYEGWLDEPAQILKSMLADGMAQFTEEIAKISKESRSRARIAMKNLEAEAQKKFGNAAPRSCP
jgi:vacuolar-type H+-ATPase subunit E/Vma4